MQEAVSSHFLKVTFTFPKLHIYPFWEWQLIIQIQCYLAHFPVSFMISSYVLTKLTNYHEFVCKIVNTLVHSPCSCQLLPPVEKKRNLTRYKRFTDFPWCNISGGSRDRKV